MNPNIYISQPEIGPEEKNAVLEVLNSGNIVQGPKVAEFEEAFAGFTGSRYAVAVNSGTAAIHTALHVAGIGPGDSVITTPFTFIGTANPVLMQGANLKFVDIEADTYNLDPNLLGSAYDPSVKAILPVDLYGQPADYGPIKDFAAQHGLIVIEDACQSVGAEYQNTMAGQLGQIACFSLYATKNMMSAEGGVITTNDLAYAEGAKSFRQHGMVGPYEYTQLGYNYRSTDILAAIAMAQLQKVETLNQIRQQNAASLTAGLEDIAGLKLPIVRPDRTSVFHQYTVRVTPEFPLSRDELMNQLVKKGIRTGIYYPKPLYVYPHLDKLNHQAEEFPRTEQAAKEVLSLPVHPGLSQEQIDYIIHSIREIAGV